MANRNLIPGRAYSLTPYCGGCMSEEGRQLDIDPGAGRSAAADRGRRRGDAGSRPLDRYQLHVWVAKATRGGDPRLLTQGEASRAGGFHQPADRRRFVAGRSFTRTLLGGYLGETGESLRFHHGPTGKPLLRGQPIHFNLSHSGEVLVCAIAAVDVGVDVESRESVGDPEDLFGRVLSRREEEWVRSLGPDEMPEAFLRTWVRKEAVSKGIGEGLGLAFPTIETPMSLQASGSRVRVRGRRGERWFVWDVPIAPGWASAVAAPTSRMEVRRFDWDGGRIGPGADRK